MNGTDGGSVQLEHAPKEPSAPPIYEDVSLPDYGEAVYANDDWKVPLRNMGIAETVINQFERYGYGDTQVWKMMSDEEKKMVGLEHGFLHRFNNYVAKMGAGTNIDL